MWNAGSRHIEILKRIKDDNIKIGKEIDKLIKTLSANESDDCKSDDCKSDDYESDGNESDDYESDEYESDEYESDNYEGEDNEIDDIENVRYDKHTDTEFPLETPPCATPPLVGKSEAFNSPIIAESDKALDPLTISLDTSPLISRPQKSPCYNYIGNGCTRNNCRFIHLTPNLIRYLEYIGSAKEKLDICAYNITSKDIYKAILKVQKSGVPVRVITNVIQGTNDGNLIKELSKSIEVRVNDGEEGGLMHHKFVIIDNKVLLTGSFNLTTKGIYYNYEDVFILEDLKKITYYITGFETLWTDFQNNPLEKNPSNANNRDTKTHILKKKAVAF